MFQASHFLSLFVICHLFVIQVHAQRAVNIKPYLVGYYEEEEKFIELQLGVVSD